MIERRTLKFIPGQEHTLVGPGNYAAVISADYPVVVHGAFGEISLEQGLARELPHPQAEIRVASDHAQSVEFFFGVGALVDSRLNVLSGGIRVQTPANMHHDRVLLTTHPTQIVLSRSLRSKLIIQNMDSTNWAQVGTDSVAPANSIAVPPLGSIELSTSGAVFGRANPDVTVGYLETF